MRTPTNALVGAVLCTNVADGMLLVLIPLAAVAASDGSPTVVATVVALGWAPGVVATVWTASLVDRVGSRRVMAGVQAVRLAAVAVPCVVGDGGALLAALVVVAVVASGSEMAIDNALEVAVARTAEKAEYSRLYGRLQGVELVSNRFAGPLGGALLWTAVDTAAFAAPAALYALSLVPISALTLAGATGAGEPVALRGIAHRVLGHRLLRDLLVVIAGVGLSVGLTSSILALFVQDVLDASPALYGWIVSANAAGGVLGATVAARVVERLGPARVLLWMFLAAGAGQAVVAVSTESLLPLVGAAVFGLSATVMSVGAVTLRQAVVPDAVRGRVGALFRAVATVAVPVGAFAAGPLAEVTGLRGPWLAAVAVHLVVAGVLVAGRRRAGADDAERVLEPFEASER